MCVYILHYADVVKVSSKNDITHFSDTEQNSTATTILMLK